MKKLLIVMLIIMVVAAIGFGSTFVISGMDFSDLPNAFFAASDADFSQIDEVIEDTDGITGLVVSGKSERVIVKNHDEDSIAIKYFTSNYKKTTFEVADGEIRLKSTLDWKSNIFKLSIQTQKTDYIQVLMPTGFGGSFDLTTASDDISLELDGELAAVKVNSSSGSVKVLGVTSAGEVSIKSSSGSLTVADCSFLDAQIESNSGSIKITNSTFADLQVKGRSESIKLSGVMADEIVAITSSGSISGDGVFGKAELKTSSARIEMRLDCPNISAVTSSGRIALSVAGGRGEFEVELKTSSGKNVIDGGKVSDHYTAGNGAEKHLYAKTSNANINITFAG